MNFDLDDPLGDLLSDGSNDSFFEKSTVKKAVTTQKSVPATPNEPAKAKLENLFGIGGSNTDKPSAPALSGPSSLIGMGSGRKVTETSKIQPRKPTTPVGEASALKPAPTKKEIKFEDDDDSSLDLGFDPRKPKGGKKSSILDDLLGYGSETKNNVNEPAAPKIIPKSKTPPVINASKSDAGGTTRLQQQFTFDKTDAADEVPISGRSRPLLKRESSNSMNDPLGIFASNPGNPDGVANTKDPPKTHSKKGSTMDWLGLRDEPSTVTHSTAEPPSQPINRKASTSDSQHQPPLHHFEPTITNSTYPMPQHQSYHEFQPPQPSSITHTATLLAATNFEAEAAFQSLKQQEGHLMIAAQMRNQETVLMDMQKKQQQLLQQQESHFNGLFQKQMQRQTALEISIRRQQDRLNSHIQLLMSQPNTSYTVDVDHHEPQGEDTYEDDRKRDGRPKWSGKTAEIELRAHVKILELEKLRLEDLVQNMKLNHEQELDFLEQSHKKQVAVLDESAQKLEQRLREENDNIKGFYRQKLEDVELEKVQASKQFEVKTNEMEENYAKILAKLKTKYEDDLEALKVDHNNMIDTLRQSKLMEFSLVQENTSYLQTLKNATNYLETASDTFQSVKDDLQDKVSVIHRQKETELAAYEKRLQVQQDQMNRSQEANAAERCRLLELVKSLETKLNSLNQTAAEEQWTFRQQQAVLEAERVSFERERSFAREQILRDEKRIDTLKSQQIDEYQRQQKQLDDERESVLMEKSKLEMMSRLQKPVDAAASRVEIDSAIKIAQDATRQADVERERYMEMQRQHELKRRQLVDQENEVRSKEMDLESAIKTSQAQEKNAEAATKSAKYLEQQLQSKMQFLQQSFHELTVREQKFSEEKIALSRERLELQAIRQKAFQSKCSLCKIGERNQELSEILSKSDRDRIGPMPMQLPNLDIGGSMFNTMDSVKYQDALDLEVRSSLQRMENMKMFQVDLTTSDLNDLPNIENELNDFAEPDLLLAKMSSAQASKFF